MKRILAVTGATLLLAGCGQNDNRDMGGPGDSEYGSGSSTTEPAAPSRGVETGINGTGPSGNGSGGTVPNTDTNDAAASAATTESGEADLSSNTDANEPAQLNDQIQIDGGVSQDFPRTDTNRFNSGAEPQRSQNPQ